MLASIGCVNEDNDIIAITNEGIIIRTAVKEIPVYNRSATGVKVMRLDDECKIVKISITESEKEEEITDGEALNTDLEASTEEVKENPTADEAPASKNTPFENEENK